MPLIDNGNGNVSISYQLSDELKDLLTKEFSEDIISRLKDIFPKYQDDKSLAGLFYFNSSSNGFFNAFRSTCESLNIEALLKEANNLPWYDYDIFIDEIADRVGELYFGKERLDSLYNEIINDIENENYTDGENEDAN